VGFKDKVFGKVSIHTLLKEFGSPLYVYDEEILRQRCRDMKNLMGYPNFRVNYSAKANTNVHLLKIVLEEGLDVDAMSPGEMYLEMKAGFPGDRIMFIGNNVSADEFKYAIDHGIYISVDSLSQLETLGKVNQGGKVCLRINPGIGAGHHEKVVTGGKKAKFGIAIEDLPKAQAIAEKYNMRITGLNQHIGSLFLDPQPYIEAASNILELATGMPEIEIIDIGGGLGIPYKHNEEPRLDLAALGKSLDELIEKFVAATGRLITFRIEPGRYVVAECGVILGTIHSVKESYNTLFIGTDIGFNTLIRPAMYDSYHEVDIIPARKREYKLYEKPAYVVGQICESGDILAHDRILPVCEEGDAIMVYDAGAYGFAMASTYNSRPLPAELLISNDGGVRVIRKAQTLNDLWPE
jgi:diaminopimelate decarboxylase